MIGKPEPSHGPVPGNPAIPDLARDGGGLRTVGGDVDGDAIFDVVEIRMVGMDQANPGITAGDVVGL